GVLILFFGICFLLKYANDLGFFSIELRLISAATLGLISVGFGLKLKDKLEQLSVILQGAGIGIFYITVFASYKIYHLLPSSLALIFMIITTVFGSSLAILQNARSLAFLSITGGFLAPILTSTGSGNYVALFSYYLILNIGI